MCGWVGGVDGCGGALLVLVQGLPVVDLHEAPRGAAGEQIPV